MKLTHTYLIQFDDHKDDITVGKSMLDALLLLYLGIKK